MADRAMTYRALATDYDGTIAHDGRVNEDTLAALRTVRSAGFPLVLVTGRELSDLFNTFAHVDLFDRVVAENGALLYDPATKTMRSLALPPPPTLIDRLTRAQIPISVGHSIVATVEPHEHAVLAAIRDLGIEWHVIFNKGSVMALPADVTKATGLPPALSELGVSLEQTIGVGDAENDQAFLRLCGLSVAVANALPAVKSIADVVTDGARGDGVVELVSRWMRGEFDDIPAKPVVQ
jgi:hydroxymethylpyrimidine pyrophosphatase-like HAD family hydrolase